MERDEERRRERRVVISDVGGGGGVAARGICGGRGRQLFTGANFLGVELNHGEV